MDISNHRRSSIRGRRHALSGRGLELCECRSRCPAPSSAPSGPPVTRLTRTVLIETIYMEFKCPPPSAERFEPSGELHTCAATASFNEGWRMIYD